MSAPHGVVSVMDDHKGPYAEDVKRSTDVESGDISPLYDANGPVEFEEKKDLKRGLQQRHIQMIALAGTIGTVCLTIPVNAQS